MDALASESSVLRDRIVAAETEESDINREVAKAETDVQAVRARATRDEQRLLSGQGAAKELESLQHELVSLAKRQADLEDVELEVMQRLEDVQSALAALRTLRAEVEAKRTDAVARRDTALADLDADAASTRAEREAMAPGLPSDLLALYERLRESNGGVGAALLRHRRCEGCHLELNNVEINQIRVMPSAEVVRCEECGRILVRTAESGL